MWGTFCPHFLAGETETSISMIAKLVQLESSRTGQVYLAQKPLPSHLLVILLRLPPNVVEKEVQLAIWSHTVSEPRLAFGELSTSRPLFFSQLSTALLWASGL